MDFDSIVFTLAILVPVLIVGGIIIAIIAGSQPIINVIESKPITITHKIGELNVSIPEIYWGKFNINETKNKEVIIRNNDKFAILLTLNHTKNENYDLIWDYDNSIIYPNRSINIVFSLTVYKENLNLDFTSIIDYKVYDYKGWELYPDYHMGISP